MNWAYWKCCISTFNLIFFAMFFSFWNESKMGNQTLTTYDKSVQIEFVVK